MVTFKNYYRAVMDKSYREEFVSKLDFGEAAPYFKNVGYEHKHFSHSIMHVCPTYESWDDSGKIHLGIKSKLVIFPLTFDLTNHLCLEDFLGSAIYHGGFMQKKYLKEIR